MLPEFDCTFCSPILNFENLGQNNSFPSISTETIRRSNIFLTFGGERGNPRKFPFNPRMVQTTE